MVLQVDAALVEEDERTLRGLSVQLEEVSLAVRYPADGVSIAVHLAVQYNRALVHMALGELSTASGLLRAALLQLRLHCQASAEARAAPAQAPRGNASMEAVVQAVYAAVVEGEGSDVLDCILLAGQLSTAAVARGLLLALTALLTCKRFATSQRSRSTLLTSLLGLQEMGTLHAYFVAVNEFYDGHGHRAADLLEHCLIHCEATAREVPRGGRESSPLLWHTAYLLATVYLSIGDYARAAEIFQCCCAKQRYRPSDCLSMRALALLLQGEHEEACQAFEAAIEKELHLPLHICATANMSEIFRGVPGPYEYRLLHLILMAMEKAPSERDSDVLRGFDVEPLTPLGRLRSFKAIGRGEVALRLAQRAMVEEDFQAAVQSYRTVLESIRESGVASNRWLCKRAGGDHPKEMALLEVYHQYMAALLGAGETEEALSLTEQVLNVRGGDIMSLLYRTEALAASNRPTEALHSLQAAQTALDKDDALDEGKRSELEVLIQNNRAGLLLALKRSEESLPELQQTFGARELPECVLYNYALLLSMADRREEACTAWFLHHSINPSNSREYFADLHERTVNQVSQRMHNTRDSLFSSLSERQTLLLQVRILHDFSRLQRDEHSRLIQAYNARYPTTAT